MTYIAGLNSKNSTLNSVAATTILDTESWTGTWEQDSFPFVVPSIISDQNVSYYIQFSIDGGTVTQTSLSYAYNTARINAPHSFQKDTRWWRVVVTNNSGSTATVSVYTDKSSSNGFNAPINGTLSENYSAVVTRPTDYFSEVAAGKRQGRSLWNKFGYNQDIDVGTEVIASWGGTFTPLTTETTLTISSTSTADDDGGTGCNSIVVYGIDANRDEVIEVVTMDGTTPVITATEWLGINRVAMFLCGSGQVNAGTINITATTGGSTMAQMPLGGGVTQQCIFHIPQNHNFITEWLFINLLNRGKNAEVTVKMWVYSAISNGKQEVFSVDIDTANFVGELQLNPKLPFPITEKTVMWLEGTSDKADVIVNARFSGILERIS